MLSLITLVFIMNDSDSDSECDGVNVIFGRSHYLAYHYYYCVAEVELMTHEKVFSAVARGRVWSCCCRLNSTIGHLPITFPSAPLPGASTVSEVQEHCQDSVRGVGVVSGQCTVKHHKDIINFACMTWNFVRISASLQCQDMITGPRPQLRHHAAVAAQV